MRALLDSNPEYQNVKLIRVNWDDFKDAPITMELQVPRRSTLVMFNEGKEVGRVVAGTSASAIGALFEALES